MDTVTGIVIIIGVFAGLFVLAMILFPEFRGRIGGPWKTEVEVEGRRRKEQKQKAQSEALLEDVEAGGDASAAVEGMAGRASGRRIKAGGDVSATVSGSEEDANSKKE